MSRGSEFPACTTRRSLSPEEHTGAEELLLEVVSLLSLGEVLLCCGQCLHLLASPGCLGGGFGFSWKDIWLCQRSGGGDLGVFPALCSAQLCRMFYHQSGPQLLGWGQVLPPESSLGWECGEVKGVGCKFITKYGFLFFNSHSAAFCCLTYNFQFQA